MPIRSPRRVYKIASITANVNDDPAAIDKLPGDMTPQTTVPIYVKMKEAIGEYFGLVPLNFDSPEFTGTFGGGGLNQGANYSRNIGGFRVASYTLIADTTFTVTEKYFNVATQLMVVAPKDFRTMSIGFPKGHTVHEVIAWLATLNNFDKIRAIRTPAGRGVDTYKATATP